MKENTWYICDNGERHGQTWHILEFQDQIVSVIPPDLVRVVLNFFINVTAMARNDQLNKHAHLNLKSIEA